MPFKFAFPNTLSYSEKFGKIEFKYISLNDLMAFQDILAKAKDDKELVLQVLHNQLITPKVSLEEFSIIQDSELVKIARDFAKQEQYLFAYLQETTDEYFFTSFRKAIQLFIGKQFEGLQTSINSIMESSKGVFEDLSKQYASIAPPNSFLAESMKAISKITDRMEEPLRSLADLRPALEQLQLNLRFIAESIIPKIDFWQKWLEQNKAIFDGFNRFWEAFHKQYKIAEGEAVQVLKKYKWLITPSLPLEFVFKIVKLGRRKGNHRKELNKMFINYFSTGNFRNLEKLVGKWKTNDFFKPRMKIFRDCLFAIRNAHGKYNYANVVLPTLISQIDGIRITFMDRIGSSSRKNDWRNWFKDQTPNQRLLDIACDIFTNILFQSSLPGKPLQTPFWFNRHKIMHGEFFRYGRIEYTIRAFLILDFLAIITAKGIKAQGYLTNSQTTG
ncbi:MAG: hypothetical protein ACPLPW_08490 [bacterium]